MTSEQKTWKWDKHDQWSVLTTLLLMGIAVGIVSTVSAIVLMGAAAWKYITEKPNPPPTTVHNEYHYDVELRKDESTDCRFTLNCNGSNQ